MDQRLSIVTLAVADLDRSRRFYCDVFGWRETDGSSGQIAFFQLPGIMFALYPQSAMADEHDGPIGAPAGFTLAYNVNSADEVDRVHAEVTSRGAAGLKAPESVSWGGYSAYVSGPDGEQWEIAHNPFAAVNDDGTFGPWG